MKGLTRAELARGRKLVEAAFTGPWRYKQFEIECGACASFGQALTGVECSNPECDGSHVPATFVEAPEEYPGESEEYHAQVVATIDVPGLSDLAEKNGEAICWLRNNANELIAAKEQLDLMANALSWLYMNEARAPVSQLDSVGSVLAYAHSLGWKRGSNE